MSNDVIIESNNAVGVMRLNRPKALHTLNLGMCEDMLSAAQSWLGQDDIKLVLLKHSEGRGFCAGGDIRSMYDSVDEGGKYSQAFFYTEYQLNHLLYTYAKPTVVLMDGITMGGGVGIAMPCRYRVATERTRFAMPETGIGLFPDVGGAWYLPRLSHNMGTYMALTGEPVRGINCLKLGLATHYVSSEKLPELELALMANPEQVETILSEFCETAGDTEFDEVMAFSESELNGYDVNEILSRLSANDSPLAQKTLATIQSKSPLSTVASMKALELGATATTFAQEMTREYTLACNLTAHPDFKEGVRALLVDKDNQPKWAHTDIASVSDEDVSVLFENNSDLKTWVPA